MAEEQGSNRNTSDVAANNFAVSAPTISLPKGGGAIRGIGEKFAANPVTGTGSMSVPIATSSSRSQFGPQLSLSHSGSSDGPFALWWSLSTPTIARKAGKGLPQYRDAEESDVIIVSGAEDQVPVLKSDRTGRSRIFGWLTDETRGDKGNAVSYEYNSEDSIRVDLTQAHERNRDDREANSRGEDNRRSTNRDLKASNGNTATACRCSMAQAIAHCRFGERMRRGEDSNTRRLAGPVPHRPYGVRGTHYHLFQRSADVPLFPEGDGAGTSLVTHQRTDPTPFGGAGCV